MSASAPKMPQSISRDIFSSVHPNVILLLDCAQLIKGVLGPPLMLFLSPVTSLPIVIRPSSASNESVRGVLHDDGNLFLLFF